MTDCESNSRVEIKYGLIFLSKFLVIIEDSRVSAVNAVKTLNGIMSYGFKKSPKQFLGHNLFCEVKRRENFLRNKFQNCFLLRTCVNKVGLVFSLCLGLLYGMTSYFPAIFRLFTRATLQLVSFLLQRGDLTALLNFKQGKQARKLASQIV